MLTALLLLLFAAVVFALFVFYRFYDLIIPPSFLGAQLDTSPLYRPSKASILLSRSGPYTFTSNHTRPQICQRELLIRTHSIGLNPIDWKCVTYGFGIHALPWISGRECAGTVEEVGSEVKGWRRGERVWVCSTNYRDVRTSAFQQVRAAFSHEPSRVRCEISSLNLANSCICGDAVCRCSAAQCRATSAVAEL